MRVLLQSRASDAVPGSMLALQLTAIVLILQPVSVWYLRPLLLSLAILGLLFPTVLRTPATWGAITLLSAIRVLREWPLGDNHHYLIAYWCLAIFLALCAPRPDRFLARSARWLLAGVFVWATIWKAVLSPDFMDGRFYRVRMLTDARFAGSVHLVSRSSLPELKAVALYLKPPLDDGPDVRPALIDSPRLIRFATFLTWLTVILEGAVALVFLVPWGRWTRGIRHGMLIAFCAMAYAIAPVVGFGWTLTVMGVAQTSAADRRLRLAYVATFILLRFYVDVPWGRILLT